MRLSTAAVGLVLLSLQAPALATSQEAVPPPAVTAMLAEGWAQLAKGDATAATLIAWKALTHDPASASALALAIDAELVVGGGAAGLNAYEKWLGSRPVDAAYALRRVARAMLVELSGKQPDAKARIDALTALAADGDRTAAAALEQAASSNAFGETRALAAIGNERAVTMLLAELRTTPGSKTPVIDALAESGSPRAVQPLRGLLTDPHDLNRAAAADALGRLDATEAIPQLKSLLGDPVFTVRLKAAGALHRLNDFSGLSLLTDLTHSEHAAVRAAAAREMASQPDPTWQALVRSLASDTDPAVRLDAARLIAPYDLPLARKILDDLMKSDNPGIRAAASAVLVGRVAADFATLRALLRSSDASVRVSAAARILELTR